MLELLDLFTPAAPMWPAEDLIRYLGLSRSTGYRYIRALHSARLITAVANGYYVLGERIIELDRQIRQYDPIYHAGGIVMKPLVEETGYSALLCTLYKDSVMCVRDERVENSPTMLFSRGQRRPLLSGAASKIILPYLPPHQMKNIFTKNKKAIATAALGSDWATFRSNLSAMRRKGYAITVGEFNPLVVGVSAPIFNKSRNILGSLGIAALESDFSMDKVEETAQAVITAADKITEILSSTDLLLDRPPRGVG